MDTGVHKKATVNCISGHPLLETYNNFATTMWNRSDFWHNLLDFGLTSKMSFCAGIITPFETSSPKLVIASSM